MIIKAENAGKRFNRDWIFRKLTCTFSNGNAYAITGPNGSGKSTLLQSIAANMNVNEGKIEWFYENKMIDAETVFSQVSLCAPYLEVIEEMSATEFLLFHASFKPLISSVTVDEIIKIVQLENAAHKQIRFYSSGMKQRIKLAQAIFSDVPVLLLDEPCTNLDDAGYSLYHSLIENYCSNKLIIVSSNDVNEYSFCNNRLNILDYK
ncbi:MAG: ABC transporter ATP-binding protein [Ilyomonas sp.]